MKITFIYPDISSDFNTFQFGVATLSALLKREGHEVSLIHVFKPLDDEEFMRVVKTHDGDLYGFSSTTNMFPYVRQWAPLIKKVKNVLTICGGIHATLAPEEVISTEGIDMACIGEGERSLTELCSMLEKDKDYLSVKGLWIKNKSGVIKNTMPTLVEDLDTLPFPDREIFNYGRLAHSRKGVGLFMASRGCPFNCYYCCNHSLKKLYSENESGKYLRFRSVDYALREIKEVILNYPHIKVIHFTDDVLPAKKEWFREFVSRYKKEINLPFQCNVFPALATSEVIELLKLGGCTELGMGIESGDENTRRKILNRQVTGEKIEGAFKKAKEIGLNTYTYNMLGLPSEDMPEMLETIKINARIKPDSHQVSIFYPYPLTRLYEISSAMNLLTEKTAGNYYTDTVLDFSNVRKREIVFVKLYFNELIKLYSFSKKLEGLLDRILLSPWFPSFVFIKLEPVIHFKKYIVRAIEKNTPWLFSILYKIKSSLKTGKKIEREEVLEK